jgi:hypothetical protein
MVWIALLSARSPPRLRRCRTVRPLEASSGLTPARAANAASLRHRPGWEKLTMTWAVQIGPMPGCWVRPGARSSTMACRVARLACSSRCASRSASASRRISAWRMAWARVASRGPRRRARAVRVVSVRRTRATWRSVSSPSRSSARSRLVCAVEVVVPVRAGRGQPIGVEAQRAEHRQVRVDRVGFALAPSGPATGLLALDD